VRGDNNSFFLLKKLVLLFLLELTPLCFLKIQNITGGQNPRLADYCKNSVGWD
jgi:hypothetical protein